MDLHQVVATSIQYYQERFKYFKNEPKRQTKEYKPTVLGQLKILKHLKGNK